MDILKLTFVNLEQKSFCCLAFILATFLWPYHKRTHSFVFLSALAKGQGLATYSQPSSPAIGEFPGSASDLDSSFVWSDDLWAISRTHSSNHPALPISQWWDCVPFVGSPLCSWWGALGPPLTCPEGAELLFLLPDVRTLGCPAATERFLSHGPNLNFSLRPSSSDSDTKSVGGGYFCCPNFHLATFCNSITNGSQSFFALIAIAPICGHSLNPRQNLRLPLPWAKRKSTHKDFPSLLIHSIDNPFAALLQLDP